MFRILALTFILLSSVVHANSAILPFSAEYKAKFKGISIASGTRLLEQMDDGSYQITSIGTVLGGSMTYDDVSRFKVEDGQVITLGFRHVQAGLLGNKAATGHADREGGLVVHVNKEKFHFQAPEEAAVEQLMDAAGFSVQLQTDLKNGERDMTYYYNVVDELEKYRFRVVATETIKTKLGTYETLKVEQKKREGRSTWLWLAPDLDYHLIRAEIVRNGKSWATLETTELNISAAQNHASKDI